MTPPRFDLGVDTLLDSSEQAFEAGRISHEVAMIHPRVPGDDALASDGTQTRQALAAWSFAMEIPGCRTC